MTNLRTERTEEVRFVEFRATEGGDGQTLEGYAAVFNQWTDIRDSVGTYREQIAPGAFKRSIGQKTPVLQFDHGTHPLIGSLPLGTINVLREDRNGLFVKARLSDNWLVQPVRDAIRDGGINGMSFRFRVVSEEWGTDAEGKETRIIKEADVPELGPVVFPAYTQTAVAVRSMVGALDDEMRSVLAKELVGQRFDDVMAGDVREMLRTALNEKFTPSDNQWIWVRDYTDLVVIYELEGFDEPGTYRLNYTIADGVAILDGDPVAVTIQTTYVDANRADGTSTSTVAVEPANQDGSPVEPPAASHEDPRKRIADAFARFRRPPTERTSDVDTA